MNNISPVKAICGWMLFAADITIIKVIISIIGRGI